MSRFNRGSDRSEGAWRVRLLGCVVTVTVACAGCGSPAGPAPGADPAVVADPRGTLLTFGTGKVYYTPGVESAAAKNVGEILVREKYFSERPAAVQVRYADRRYELLCVVRAGAETNPPVRQWRALGEAVAKECFRESPVDGDPIPGVQ